MVETLHQRAKTLCRRGDIHSQAFDERSGLGRLRQGLRPAEALREGFGERRSLSQRRHERGLGVDHQGAKNAIAGQALVHDAANRSIDRIAPRHVLPDQRGDSLDARAHFVGPVEYLVERRPGVRRQILKRRKGFRRQNPREPLVRRRFAAWNAELYQRLRQVLQRLQQMQMRRETREQARFKQGAFQQGQRPHLERVERCDEVSAVD